MNREVLIERFFDTLVNGDRPASRQIIREQFESGSPATRVISDLLWPTYELIERLHRADHLSKLSYHFATRLLRVLVDQTCARLEFAPSNGQSVFVSCGPAEGDELGAQMAVDLLETAGYAVTFAGGGLPSDEVRAQAHERQPDILLMFASGPADLPGIREIIDTMNEIGACKKVRIAVGGGVFNRAEGLAEEIGAHLWATSPMEMVELLLTGEVYQEARIPQKTTAAPARPSRRTKPARETATDAARDAA
ncbi:MAG: cobalamin-dependent protein [Phycisphaeraceae bacterium]|nr:cobalamin-dependent protein [Phycisphaerae bacterium]MBX3392675.1 cobalamin-dependent protein [Phycisphaeraceae bacterium]